MEKTPNQSLKKISNKTTNIQRNNNQIQKSNYTNSEIQEYANAMMTNLKLNKLTSGTQIMMDNEKLHASEAIESGIYVTWSSNNEACIRVGSNSICICSHGFNLHEKILTRKKFSSKCSLCSCKGFNYIPTLPEEIGEYWIPHQPNFEYSKWKAKCKCKHPWSDHSVDKFLKCKTCSCFGFQSNFCCVVCDKFWHDHQTIYELEHDRLMINKPIGKDFMPFVELPEMYNLLYKNK